MGRTPRTGTGLARRVSGAPGLPDAGTAAFARCVGDVDRFMARSWSREPHHHRDPGGYADLLSLDDVDRLVSASGLRTPAFRLVRDGQPLDPQSYTRRARIGSRPVTDLADPGRVFAFFADGATIVLQGLQRSWPPLARFCRELEAALTHPVQANAYVTPPVAAGLRIHADAHDVFALHTHGRKQWVTYPPEGEDADLDLVVAAGECLYLPQGVRHAARTVDEPSVHVTVGVRTVTWQQVLRTAVDGVLEAALDGAPARLPPGFAHEPTTIAAEASDRLADVAKRLAALDGAEIADKVAERFWAARPPLLSGQLQQVLRLAGGVDDTTRVRRRPGAVCRVSAAGTGEQVALVLGDRELRAPLRLAPALEWVAQREQFTVGELAAHLDTESRRVLVTRLVREALLMIEP